MAKTVVRVLSAEAGPLAQMDVAWTGAGRRGFLSRASIVEKSRLQEAITLRGSPARHDRHGCEPSIAATVSLEVAGDPRGG